VLGPQHVSISSDASMSLALPISRQTLHPRFRLTVTGQCTHRARKPKRITSAKRVCRYQWSARSRIHEGTNIQRGNGHFLGPFAAYCVFKRGRCRVAAVLPLLYALGYEPEGVVPKPSVVFRERRRGRKPEADFACYCGTPHDRNNSLLVVEANAPNEPLGGEEGQGGILRSQSTSLVSSDTVVTVS